MSPPPHIDHGGAVEREAPPSEETRRRNRSRSIELGLRSPDTTPTNTPTTPVKTYEPGAPLAKLVTLPPQILDDGAYEVSFVDPESPHWAPTVNFQGRTHIKS